STCKQLAPFATRGRLSRAERVSRFRATTCQMDERPCHGEGWKPVALRGAEQLLKRRVRRAAAKADQDAEGGIEYSAALHVESELGRSPLSRHALLTSHGAISDARHRHGVEPLS